MGQVFAVDARDANILTIAKFHGVTSPNVSAIVSPALCTRVRGLAGVQAARDSMSMLPIY